MADSPQHILLVEDDLTICELLATLFEDEGYALTTCVSPHQAMTLLDQRSFDLVLTDGFSRAPASVAQNTADIIGCAGMTPVVLFSGHTLDIAVAQAAGFRDLITKPFDIDTLMRQVRTLLAT
jgi:DNA-binding NtrC family response regulator